MGIHSGPVVAGVVGSKIPHYSVFGETVDMAGLMEASGEPMKIQVQIFILRFCCIYKYLITETYYHYLYAQKCISLLILQISVATKDLLEKEGSFNYIKRETTNPKLGSDIVTFWLIGRKTGQGDDNKGGPDTETKTSTKTK